jgi:hypothetical protein
MREIMGWLLVGLGLLVFYLCFLLLLDHYLVEAGPLTLIGIIIFRGGIHLLKVAVAARICLDAQEQLGWDRQPPLAPASRWPGRPASANRRI